VGRRGRDAVHDEPHAADAECRARAEAADRELQVLRVVLAVQHRDPRNPRERFGEVHLRTRGRDGVGVHGADRGRRVEEANLAPRGGDHDGFLGHALLRKGRGPGEGEAPGEDALHGRGFTSTTRPEYQSATCWMSASESVFAMRLIVSLARLPLRKALSCSTRYTRGCPARFGASGATDSPLAPWQAAQGAAARGGVSAAAASPAII